MHVHVWDPEHHEAQAYMRSTSRSLLPYSMRTEQWTRDVSIHIMPMDVWTQGVSIDIMETSGLVMCTYTSRDLGMV